MPKSAAYKRRQTAPTSLKGSLSPSTNPDLKEIKICKMFNEAEAISKKNVDIFIDPTFFGIFVCGPLQSLVVNVCTLEKMFVEMS